MRPSANGLSDPERGLTSIHPSHPRLMSTVQRTRFTGRMAAPPMMAQIPATAYKAP